MTNFCNVLESLVCKDKQMLTLGDFNLPNINWERYDIVKNEVIHTMFLNTVFELDLYQFVDQTMRQNSVLDLILSNREASIINVECNEPISDNNNNAEYLL